MGRGGGDKDAWSAVLGRRRGTERKHDVILEGLARGAGKARRIAISARAGRVDEAIEVIVAARATTPPNVDALTRMRANPLIDEILQAFEDHVEGEQWRLWSEAMLKESKALGTEPSRDEGEEGKRRPFDEQAEGAWEQEFRSLLEGGLEGLLGSTAQMREGLGALAQRSARESFVCAFSGALLRRGVPHLAKLGGGRAAMREAISPDWPPSKDIREVFGYEDLLGLMEQWLVASPQDEQGSREDLRALVQEQVRSVFESGQVGETW
jgi:hypothetical protein